MKVRAKKTTRLPRGIRQDKGSTILNTLEIALIADENLSKIKDLVDKGYVAIMESVEKIEDKIETAVDIIEDVAKTLEINVPKKEKKKVIKKKKASK